MRFVTTYSLLQFWIISFMQNTGNAGRAEHEYHWSYDVEHGPSHWCHLSNENQQCCGRRQSPIDIDEFEVTMEFFQPLKFINYTVKPTRMTLSNNGHTVVVVMDDDDQLPMMTGGGIRDMYAFSNMHFHWGKDDDHGSEHTISGKRYPLEMHIVHYNTKYNSLKDASKNTDGLAVVAVFFHLADKDNDALKGIIKALDEVRYSNETKDLTETFPVSRLLPLKTDDFYRYSGSLTTPPCSEVVTWTVLDTPVPVSEEQLQKFRSLRMRPKSDELRDIAQLVDNYRPTQSLGGRRVHARSTLAKIRALTGDGDGRSTAPSRYSAPPSSSSVVLLTVAVICLTSQLTRYSQKRK